MSTLDRMEISVKVIRHIGKIKLWKKSRMMGKGVVGQPGAAVSA